jgi:hypothetical protein
MALPSILVVFKAVDYLFPDKHGSRQTGNHQVIA